MTATGHRFDQGQFGVPPDLPWEEILSFYREVRPRLAVSLFHLLESKQDAEDVAQDAFIQAARKWHTLRNEDPKIITAWLYAIALNLARDKLRQRGRHRELIVSDYESVAQVVSRHISPEQAYEVSVAFDVLRSLSDRQREVYLLRHYFGLEIKDIARVLSRRDSTVRVQLSRAQERITRRLGQLDEPSANRTESG